MKKFLLSLACFSLIHFCFGFSREDIKFSGQTGFSILHGNIYEEVLRWEEDKFLTESLLDWEIKALPAVSLQADLDIFRYAHIMAKGQLGFPCASGSMQDYDWLNYSNSNEITNYSKHNNQILNYYSAFIELGGNIPLPFLEITLIPVAAFEYEYIYFSASDGYGIYKSRNYVPHSYEGEVSSYQQEFSTFDIGIKAQIKPVSQLELGAAFYWSPVFNINDLDSHLARVPATYFLDQMTGGHKYSFEFNSSYCFNSMHKTGIKVGYSKIIPTKGTTYIRYGDNGKWNKIDPEKSLGATYRNFWDFSVYYKFCI